MSFILPNLRKNQLFYFGKWSIVSHSACSIILVKQKMVSYLLQLLSCWILDMLYCFKKKIINRIVLAVSLILCLRLSCFLLHNHLHFCSCWYQSLFWLKANEVYNEAGIVGFWKGVIPALIMVSLIICFIWCIKFMWNIYIISICMGIFITGMQSINSVYDLRELIKASKGKTRC